MPSRAWWMRATTWALVVFAVAATGFAARSGFPEVAEQHWGGAIINRAGVNEIDFTLRLQRAEDGTWRAWATTPLVGLENRPLDTITVDGRRITFGFEDEDGARRFEGTLSEEGDRIEGRYVRDGYSVPFELERLDSAPEYPRPSTLRPLGADGKELAEQFDDDRDKLRILMLLSPTCTTCLIDARLVQRHVLDGMASDRIRAYVVWEPVAEGDNRDVAQAATRLVTDPRASHYWTDGLELAEAFKAPLDLEKSVAWSVLLVYPPGASWTAPVPTPASYMHSLNELPPDRKFDGLLLRREIWELLRAMEE